MKGVVSQEEFDGLESTLQNEYTRGDDGRFYANIEASDDGWEFQNVRDLRETMRSERKRREDWEKKFKGLERKIGDVDPDEIGKLADYKQQIEDMKTWTPDEKVQARIQTIENEYKTKLDEANRRASEIEAESTEQITAKERQINRMVIRQEAGKILNKMKCLAPDLHMEDVIRGCKVVDVDERVIEVVDRHGDPVNTKKKGVAGKMSLEEFLEGFKKSFPQNFEGSNASGGGGDPSAAGGRGGIRDDKFKNLPPVERMKEIRRRRQQA